MKNTKVCNFSLIPHPNSCVNAYNKEVLGCQKTGADVMLTFGSTISPLNSNNQALDIETMKFVDVFLTKSQAEHLVKELQKVLLDHELSGTKKD